jgi:hypothetical protein
VCGPHKVSFQAIFKLTPRAVTFAGVSKKKLSRPKYAAPSTEKARAGFPEDTED